MKKILTVFAMTILMAAIAPQTRATAYWGTVVAPTGQTLYWSLVGGDRIAIVCPGIGPYFPWSMYGTDYPYVAAPVLTMKRKQLCEELKSDVELASYLEMFMKDNAIKLFEK